MRRPGARLGAAILLPGLLVAGWELQRRRDARRIAADPEVRELARPLEGRSREVRSADGTRLHVEVFGDEGAPTIVLAHGWICRIGFWHHQIRDLCGHLRVVAYDQRGHGQSQAPHRGGYSTDALADDLEAVLEACVPAGERAVVAGHSMGGMTLAAWAGRHPDQVERRVAAAALISTGMGDLVSQLLVLQPRWGGILNGAAGSRLSGLPIPIPAVSTPISHRLTHHIALGKNASPGVVAFCERMFLDCPAPVRAGFGRALSSLDLHEHVPLLTVPTLVVVGDQDRLTPPIHAQRLAEALPDVAGLEVLPGIGHMAPLEAPAQVTAQLDALAGSHLRAALARR